MTDEQRAAYLGGADPGELSAADVAALDELRELLGDDAVWAEPPAGLEDRIVSSIASSSATAARDAGHPVAAPETHSAPVSASEPTDPVVPIGRARSARWRWGLLSAAAAVVVALGITLGITLSGSSSHPQQFAAKLAATPLAPSAAGSVTLTKTASGWKITLHASGLPRRDHGRYYEAWLKNASGVLVPIGTFNDGRNVTLWSAVSPADFPTLTITQQVVGGGEDSSGKVVLKGLPTRVH
jgi:hypothetical protein